MGSSAATGTRIVGTRSYVSRAVVAVLSCSRIIVSEDVVDPSPPREPSSRLRLRAMRDRETHPRLGGYSKGRSAGGFRGDAVRSVKPTKCDRDAEESVLRLLDESPPEGYWYSEL
jgi:hypothetical protein